MRTWCLLRERQPVSQLIAPVFTFTIEPLIKKYFIVFQIERHCSTVNEKVVGHRPPEKDLSISSNDHHTQTVPKKSLEDQTKFDGTRQMDTDFTFWLVLSMLIFLILTSITVLIRACIGDRCFGCLSFLFGPTLHGGAAGDREDPEATPRPPPPPALYVISPLVVEHSAGPRWREAPPTTDSAYTGICSTPPPPYDPPPAYHTLLHGLAGRKRRKSTSGSVRSTISNEDGGTGGGGRVAPARSAVGSEARETAADSRIDNVMTDLSPPEVYVNVILLESSAHWLWFSGCFLWLLYCPAVFGHFSPTPVKTDRAVRVQ